MLRSCSKDKKPPERNPVITEVKPAIKPLSSLSFLASRAGSSDLLGPDCPSILVGLPWRLARGVGVDRFGSQYMVRALTQVPLRSGRVLKFPWISTVLDRFPWDPGRFSYPPGPI